MKKLNLCFLGFGNVGRALAQLLLSKREELREQYGIEWAMTGVATRRTGWLASPGGLDVEGLLARTTTSGIQAARSDVTAWLRAARADVLFETTSLNPYTGQPATEHIRAALLSGAHAITANKGPIVHAYRELSALAGEMGRRFMFESTVADCLPVFSLFREALPAARVRALSGVLNSTTGCIIEEMESGKSFEEGVRRAQALGIAETDPAYDVDGWDAAVKVCALVRVLMNAPLRLEEIEREGIRELDQSAVRDALAGGARFKLVSRAELTGEGRVLASVRPEKIGPGSPLAMVRGTSLMVHFELDVLPGLTLAAHDPNLQSTAYGLLADFINAVRD